LFDTRQAPSVFEMPDGKKLELGDAISNCLAPEAFAPLSGEEGVPASVPGVGSLASLIADAISGSELNIDAKKELYGTVIVTGGNTLLPGFVDRLSSDTVNLLHSQQPGLGNKLGFLAPRTSTERLFSSWIGGSIVSTLGNFSSYWVTKAEYDEFGANVVNKKCP
jgi:actin-related protein 4